MKNLAQKVSTYSPRKVIALSDIHGCYDALRSLSLEHYIADGYRVVFMGDYIGYGNKSVEALKYVISLRNRYPEQVIVLMGNWEDMLHTALFHEDKQERDLMAKILYKKRWGKEFQQFRKNSALRKIVKSFPDIMDTAYTDGNYCFVHAGVNPVSVLISPSLDKIITDSEFDDMIWNFDFIDNAASLDSPYRFVVGHRPVQNITNKKDDVKPYVSGCVIGVDMGASKKKGYLGFIRFDENGRRSFRIVSVSANH